MYQIDLSNRLDGFGFYYGQVMSDRTNRTWTLNWKNADKSVYLDGDRIGSAQSFSELNHLIKSHLERA